MAATVKDIRYPEGGDNNDVPLWMQRLAEDVTEKIDQAVANNAARDALIGADLWVGKQVWNVAAGAIQVWNGATWDTIPNSTHTHDLSAYQTKVERGVANGYASLDAGTKVPSAELGGAGADSTKYLRGDRTWQTFPTAGSTVEKTDSTAVSDWILRLRRTADTNPRVEIRENGFAMGPGNGALDMLLSRSNGGFEIRNLADSAYLDLYAKDFIASGTFSAPSVTTAAWLRNGTEGAYFRNSGSPEGNLTAPAGSWCLETVFGIIYYKRTGSGNTGWVPISATGALIRSNTGQSLSSGVNTLLTGYTWEIFDNGGFFTEASSASRFTIPAGRDGVYLIRMTATMVGSFNDTTGGLWIMKNGTTTIPPGSANNQGWLAGKAHNVFTVYLQGGDYVEFYGKQSSGSSQTFNSGEDRGEFTIAKVA